MIKPSKRENKIIKRSKTTLLRNCVLDNAQTKNRNSIKPSCFCILDILLSNKALHSIVISASPTRHICRPNKISPLYVILSFHRDHTSDLLLYFRYRGGGGNWKLLWIRVVLKHIVKGHYLLYEMFFFLNCKLSCGSLNFLWPVKDIYFYVKCFPDIQTKSALSKTKLKKQIIDGLLHKINTLNK